MRGWIVALLGMPLLLPAVVASTDVRAFHAEVDECSAIVTECSTVQDGTFQIDCQQGSCDVVFHVDATYESQLPLTTKSIEARGVFAGADQSAAACRASTTAKAVRCVGTGHQTVFLKTATCRSYDIVSTVHEQVARIETGGTEEPGLTQKAVTSFTLCRSGSGAVSVTSA